MNFILTPLLRLRVLSALFALTLSLGSTLSTAQSCYLACGANTNVSVDENCEAEITEDVLLLDDSTCSAAAFTVLVEDAYGNIVANPIVDAGSYIGQQLTVSVVALDIDGAIINSCWGYVVLEDYLAPVADCPDEPIEMPCANVESFTVDFIDACEGIIPGTLVFESPKEDICDGSTLFDDITALGLDPTDYSASVTKVFSAQDSKGNVAEQCTLQILIERVDLALVVGPPNFEYSTALNSALNCDGSWNESDCFHANFQGDFAPDDGNIDVVGDGTHDIEGSAVDFSAAPLCISVNGTSEEPLNSGDNTTTDYCLTMPCAGFFQFEWSAEIFGGGPNSRFFLDEAEYVLNGTAVLLTEDEDATADAGFVTLEVAEDDELCFRVNSMSRGAYTVLDICNIVLSGQAGIVLNTDSDGDGVLDSTDGNWDDNEDGYPDYNEVGVPSIGGVPIYPLPDATCNIGVYYQDQTYPIVDDCKQQILRIWHVTEWYCGTEVDITIPQTIIIKDFEAPVVTCAAATLTEEEECLGFETITTNTHSYTSSGDGSCGAEYIPRLPGITDNCATEFEIDVQYTQMETGNAGFIDKWDGASPIELDMGLTEITFLVYDPCLNLGQCSYMVNVVDETPPTPICDQNTVVSLTTTGEAFVYASSFDDGSHDDCQLKKILVRRMDTTCECDAPVYPDATYLGEYDGHHYYHSSYAVDWFKASDLSVAMGGYLVDFDDTDEQDWVEASVGIDPYHYQHDDCKNKVTLSSYVMELEDPCTFSNKVKFCCDDVANDDIMVVLRAIDKYGNFNDCMVNVDVQDKIGPTIECGPDVVVECNFPFDSEAPDFSHVDGVGATATNHCGDDLVPVPSYNIVDGNCGSTDYVEITYTVTDGDGNETSCSQTVDFEDPDAITLANIIWPDPTIEIMMCDNPETLSTDITGLPTYTGISTCHVLAYNYSDVLFYLNNNEPDACFKIRRTWTVIDWCTGAEFNDPNGAQTIKAVSDVAPVIDGDCAQVSECTEAGECEAVITLSQTASDTDCTLPENLVWTAYIDFNSDGSFDEDPITTTGATLELTQTFPIGNHKIKWQVDDRCGNTDVCVQDIEVVTCNAPTIYCTGPNLILPIGEEGEVEIWVTDWDCEATLECDLEPILSFSATEVISNVTYSCDDIPDGETSAVVEQAIYAIAYDQNGNIVSTAVIVTAEIQDNSGACDDSVTGGSEDNGRHAIYGLVALEDGRILSEVEVVLDGSDSAVMTDETGTYEFPDMDAGGFYTVMPDKEDAHQSGVSTLDILVLQRHLLNLDALDSPYKMIAADVNNDGSVTAADIVDIRKLVLEYYSNYPQNVAWRFVDMQYAFIDPNNPLIESFTEDYQIPSINSDMIVNFIAMKVGDLNNSVEILGFNNTEAEVRSGEKFAMTVEPIDAQLGQIVKFPVYAEQSVYGFQFSLDYVGSELTLLGLEPGAMDLQDDHYRLSDTGIAVSYTTPNLVSYTADEPIFYIVAEANAKADVTKFNVANTGIDAQAYNETMQIIKPQFDHTVIAEEGFALYQNTPNPFTGNTDISFSLPQNMEAELMIRDITGKVVFTEKKEFAKGLNTVNIQRTQLQTSGIYYYSIEAGNYTETRKMVLLN